MICSNLEKNLFRNPFGRSRPCGFAAGNVRQKCRYMRTVVAGQGAYTYHFALHARQCGAKRPILSTSYAASLRLAVETQADLTIL